MKLRKRIERNVVIKPSANNGFIVEVGCVKLAYSDHHQMCRDLADYLSDPKKFEKMHSEFADPSPFRPCYGLSGISGLTSGLFRSAYS